MSKRKRSSLATTPAGNDFEPPVPLSRQTSSTRRAANPVPIPASPSALNPDETSQVIDAPSAHRASPDCEERDPGNPTNGVAQNGSESPLSDAPETVEPPKKKRASGAQKKQAAAKPEKQAVAKSEKQPATAPKTDDKMEEMLAGAAARKTALKAQKVASGEADSKDPEADEEDGEADPEEIKEALSRPPPINSDYLPLPWKGRLGYACLNTYLRNSNPPVFQSRTTRIASILEHRHPLKDPSQPEHATKNRPDKEQPADIRRGQEFVEKLGIANCKDMIKMLRWNDKYNIKFFRLSSEAFPFASHAEYGYKLAPFASEALAEVGKVVAELGHRVTTHPGQFTQLGTPRKEVVEAAFKDLEYHDEMLSLLKLPPQQDRDAVMIMHMGGVFGDKPAALDRFRENYAKLSPSIKNRLVLENDDMSYSVHDLLPICKELNIPFVLDFHHHNIIFDSDKIHEGTKEIMDLFPEILETWRRKNITPKMHYSEPTPPAITGTQRRKHNPRPATLPPCPNDMDLMIEAKDKEQAVFELMRTFKLPGFDRFNDILPHVRRDDNKPVRLPAKKKTPKKKGKKAVEDEEEEIEEEEVGPTVVPEEEVGMGGPENRVYWPPTMEEWLRPVKKVVKKKEPAAGGATKPKTKEEMKAAKAAKQEAAGANGAADGVVIKAEDGEEATAKTAPAKKGKGKKAAAVKTEELVNGDSEPAPLAPTAKKTPAPKRKPATPKVKKEATPEESDASLSAEESDASMPDLDQEKEMPPLKRSASSRQSSRAKPARMSYAEDEEDEE